MSSMTFGGLHSPPSSCKHWINLPWCKSTWILKKLHTNRTKLYERPKFPTPSTTWTVESATRSVTQCRQWWAVACTASQRLFPPKSLWNPATAIKARPLLLLGKLVCSPLAQLVPSHKCWRSSQPKVHHWKARATNLLATKDLDPWRPF